MQNIADLPPRTFPLANLVKSVLIICIWRQTIFWNFYIGRVNLHTHSLLGFCWMNILIHMSWIRYTISVCLNPPGQEKRNANSYWRCWPNPKFSADTVKSHGNPLSFQDHSHKMLKHTQTIRRFLPTNRLCVFDHFVELAHKGFMEHLIFGIVQG